VESMISPGSLLSATLLAPIWILPATTDPLLRSASGATTSSIPSAESGTVLSAVRAKASVSESAGT
jgi:hypothetical protein